MEVWACRQREAENQWASDYALAVKHWQIGDALGMNWLPKRPAGWSQIKKVDLSALDKAPVVDFSI